MTKEELEHKKSVLRQYKGYEQELNSIQYKIKELERKIRNVRAQQLSDMPQTPFTTKGGNEAINELVDLKNEYETLHSNAIEECKRIERLINNLDDPFHRSVLRHLYINQLSWKETMEKMNCSKTGLHNLQDEALNKIKIMN